jgi:hypothetical protein
LAGKADFTAEEWFTLQRAMVGGPILVSVAEGGFFESIREMMTLYQDLASAKNTYPSLLVRELAEVDGFDSGFKPRTAPGEIEGPALDALRAAAAILQAKAPEELDAYRDFVYQLALHVAQTARGVSPAEQAALAKIQQAMGSEG